MINELHIIIKLLQQRITSPSLVIVSRRFLVPSSWFRLNSHKYSGFHYFYPWSWSIQYQTEWSIIATARIINLYQASSSGKINMPYIKGWYLQPFQSEELKKMSWRYAKNIQSSTVVVVSQCGLQRATRGLKTALIRAFQSHYSPQEK